MYAERHKDRPGGGKRAAVWRFLKFWRFGVKQRGLLGPRSRSCRRDSGTVSALGLLLGGTLGVTVAGFRALRRMVLGEESVEHHRLPQAQLPGCDALVINPQQQINVRHGLRPDVRHLLDLETCEALGSERRRR